MPTTVTKSIGSAGGRDYSTIQAFFDAIPANLVTADQKWVGECYNDSEFVSASAIVLSGKTVDATRYVTLKAAAGQSFRDHATASTNPLKYDATKGVAIRVTGGTTAALGYSGVGLTRFEGLQIKSTSGYVTSIGQIDFAAADGVVVDNCICEGQTTSNFSGVLRLSGTVRNSIIYNTVGGTGVMAFVDTFLYNCTIVRPSNGSAGGRGIWHSAYNPHSCKVVNTAVFGFSDVSFSLLDSGSKNNASDLASGIGTTGCIYNQTFTNQFEGTTSSAPDFRTKSTATLKDAGFTDTTNGPADIIGTPRPQGAAYDIGCWEVPDAGQPFSLRRRYNRPFFGRG